MNSLHGHSADRQFALISSGGLFKPFQADGDRTDNDRALEAWACGRYW